MRSTNTDLHLFRRRSGRCPVESPAADAPWPPHRIVTESARVYRRLQQLEARPWWRVSGRDLDEIDAQVDVLRAHAGGGSRG